MHSDDLNYFFPLLDVISRLCDEDRIIMLEFLNSEACTAMYECMHNGIYNKDIPLSERRGIQKAIRGEKAEFEYLARKRGSHIKKHKHLIKVGGNTGLILKSLLPVLAKYLKSKNKNESIREDVHGSDLSG